MGPIEVTQIAGALSAINTLIDTAKKVVSLKSAVKDQAQLSALQQALINAQSATLELQQEYAALVAMKEQLEKQVAQLKAWDEDKANYELKPLAPGVLAYAYAPKTEPTKPPHWLCPNCWHEAKKSILYLDHQRSAWRCPACRTDYPLPPQPFRPGRLTR